VLLEKVQHLLVEQDLLDHGSLEAVRRLQRESGASFEDALERVCGVSRDVLKAFISEHLGIPMVPLSPDHLDAEAVARVPEKVARMYHVVPILTAAGRLVVAMSDPMDLFQLDAVAAVAGRPVDAVYSSPEEVDAALAAAYGSDANRSAAELMREIRAIAEPAPTRPPARSSAPVAVNVPPPSPRTHPVIPTVREEAPTREALEEVEAPIVRLVHLLIRQAIQARASDIHVDPGRDGTQIRYRVDGVLTRVNTVSHEAAVPLMSRIKILAELDISEKRLPQDGNITISMDGTDFDLRVATTPTIHGEGAVIRILDQSKGKISLEAMGLPSREREALVRVAEESQGFVLVTGPTGSGKSTTLYAILNQVDRRSRKVITLEDPVEYRMDGVTQIPIHPRTGMTFAKGLRSVLRQDPDVVLVGEIRDGETAQTAVQAAITGHLLLSTLHTNGSLETVARLVDLGIPVFQVREVLRCVIAQRLVRRLCSDCRQATGMNEPTRKLLDVTAELPVTEVYRPRGCPRCRGTGFVGRVGVYEILQMDDAIRSALTGEIRLEPLRAAARRSGWRTLWENGVERVLDGTTSPEEVARCLPRN